MTTNFTVERFLEYVRTSRSKNTLTMYRQGLKKYTEWSGKTINEILQQRVKDWTSDDLFQKKRFSREIEKFYAYLIKERGYSLSTATTHCQGIRALFSYYEMPITINNDINKRKTTTRDFVPEVQQYAKMFKVADNIRDKLILSFALTLGWRISDFAKIKKADLPNLDQTQPIPFEVITQKEQTIAKSFLASEVVALLAEYLPTLGENPHLFPSNGKGHLDHTTFNRILKDLAKKAKIKIPSKKRLRFHCFRKRFLSEAANLRIDNNLAKLLVGKAVEPSMLAYLSEANLREAFLKVSEVLKLSNRKTSVSKTDNQELAEVKSRLDKLERKLNLIAAIDPKVMKRADELLENLLTGTLRIPSKKGLSLNEKLDLILKEQEKREQEEYQKMIDENGNGDNES